MPVSVFLMLKWGFGNSGFRDALTVIGGGLGKGAGCFRGAATVFSWTVFEVLEGRTDTAEPFNVEAEKKSLYSLSS